MTINMLRPFPWFAYSRKLMARVDNPYCSGKFTKEDADSRDMFFAEGSCGSVENGNIVHFYWLIDKTDGVIVDSRFLAFGDSALLGASEVTCELIIGKNYDQARRISADLIDKHVQDKGAKSGFPQETWGHINLVVDAIENTASMCEHIPLSPSYTAPPIMGREIEVVDGGWPNFKELTLKQKLAVIEEVLDKEVRPFIELDAGGVEVLNLLNDNEVIIAYQGTCTSCFSATGATLSYIQQVLRAKVHPDLTVIPNL